MREEILSAAAARKLFFTPEALEMVMSNDRPFEFANTVFSHLAANTMFIDRQDVMDCIAGDKVLFQSKREDVVRHNKFTPDIHIVKDSDITGESTSEGKINDFANYFRARFFSLKRIIEKRPDFGKGMDISRVKSVDREVKFVGIVYEKSTTKNGHTMLTLEDETGTIKVFISKDSPLISQSFVDDEVVGIKGTPNRDRTMVIPDKIFRPDIPKSHVWERSDTPSKIAFLSDVHIGSCTFLDDDWHKMIRWLKDFSVKEDVNYLVFPGDVVDGIGVFPDQDKELVIKDIDEQYRKLSEYLKDVPDHITMVVHPGNHDACRLAEPQPALDKRFTKYFDSNILMVGNPVYIDVEGRTVLTYHGKSMDDWIAAVQDLTYDHPLKVMRQMCVRRHLAPIYGQRNALAPEKKDYLVMEKVPDIFVSGHVHGAGQDIYNDVRMINASTWQSQTEYQRQHNFNPDPGIMPVVSLGTGEIRMHNFHKERWNRGIQSL